MPSEDSPYGIAYAASRRLGFIPADAECVARAWQRQSERTGHFDPRAWPADPALAAELNRELVGIKGGAALRVGSNAWGVHVPEEPHSEIDPTRTGTVVLWCGGGASGGGLKGRRGASGRELKEVAALFEGLRARSQSPRGLLVLVVGLIGLELNIITNMTFSITVVVALGTNLMTLPLLTLFIRPQPLPQMATAVNITREL